MGRYRLRWRRHRRRQESVAAHVALIRRYSEPAPTVPQQKWVEYARWNLIYDDAGKFLGYQWALPE